MSEKKILAVDDNKQTLLLIERILKRSDWHFKFAEDGETALEIFDDFKPDVVTLDYTLQGMNGKETFIELDKKRTNSSIIFLTAHTDEAIVTEFLELGAFGYLTKPIRPVELLFNISKAYGHKMLKDAYTGLKETDMDFSELHSIVEHLSNKGADRMLNQRILIDRQKSYTLDRFFNIFTRNQPSLAQKVDSLEAIGANEFNDIGRKMATDMKYILEEVESAMRETSDELAKISERLEKLG